MDKQKLLSLTRTAAPYLICIALCVMAAHGQDNITKLSHKSRTVTETIATDAGYIVIIAGLITAWLRRSVGIGLGALVVGGALAVGGALYTSAQGYLS